MTKNEETVKNDMFGFGDKNVAFAKYFIGTSYLNGLVSPTLTLNPAAGTTGTSTMMVSRFSW